MWRAWVLMAVLGSVAAGVGAEPRMGFVVDGKGYSFDTGVLRGRLRKEGRSMGLSDVVHVESGAMISASMGLFSHYRLLDQSSRYGAGAWDWKSEARLTEDGAVEVRWAADEGHPFDMAATYKWAGGDTLDLTTKVTAKKKLGRMEVFLASYFAGFGESLVYARTETRAEFVAAVESGGTWQMFPRDAGAVEMIKDGRWQRPPNPVDWVIKSRLAGAMAMRRDAKTGLTALVMGRPGECFAVATPYGEEAHRSLYLCLMGKDLEAGESATARSRLVIGKGMTEEKAAAAYGLYAGERD